MFRAQQNAFDDAVAKATDENLTSENWEFIMDVVDKVGSEPTGGKDVVASLIKRLAHRNANVQLYTLELANALSQNCESKVNRELGSRAFTDALLRLANDRNTHQQVKTKILERMAEWAEMFKSDPDLGIMNEQYHRLKSQNPNLHPPSAPQKSRLTDLDRQKEEEELAMALKLSIQESKPKEESKPEQKKSEPTQSTTGQPVPSGTTAATVSRVRALFDFQPSELGELMFRKGDVIAVLESVYKDWWKGSLRGQTGIFPLNYVEKLNDPTPEELQREAQMESEVFAEIKNVEKLLTLLSTSSSELRGEDNDEITKLYHQTVAIRPKLIELIGKYSQKKDDFTQLNEKFIKARRDYESLLESSMAHPPQPTYGYGRPSQPTTQPYGFTPPQGPPGAAPGGYLPQGIPAPGGYPPQGTPGPQDPQKFYTQQDQQQPHQYPPQQTASPVYNSQPGRNGPAPFMLVPAGEQAGTSGHHPPPAHTPKPQNLQQQYPPQGRKPSNPVAHPSSPPPQQQQYPGPIQKPGHRSDSTHFNPQELATSAFSSPAGPSDPYAGAPYPDHDDDPYGASPLPTAPQSQAPRPPSGHSNQPPQAQQYSAYVPPGQGGGPSQPGFDAPQPPNFVPSPLLINKPQPQQQQQGFGDAALPSQAQGGQRGYKPYQRPGSSGGRDSAQGGPENFYGTNAY